MDRINIASMIDIENKYRDLVESLEEKYKCNWDDEIHDSFINYVNQIRECFEAIHEIRCKMEELEQEVEELLINDIIEKSSDLCLEVDSLC